MEITLRQKQEMILDILSNVIELCEKYNITYYCQAGTVLGAIRHKGFIPWDDDADIIIPNNEIDHFVEIANKYLPDRFFVDYYKFDKKSYRLFPRIGFKNLKTKSLHLDVFRLVGLPDDRETQLKMIETFREYTLKNKFVRAPFYKLLLKGRFKYLFDKIFDNKKYDNLFDNLASKYDYNKSTYVMNPSGKYGQKNIFKKDIYGKGIYTKFETIKVKIPSEYDFYLKQYYGDYMKFPPEIDIEAVKNKKFIL